MFAYIPTQCSFITMLFSHRVLDESLVKEVLTLNHSVPEAVISENEDEEVCALLLIIYRFFFVIGFK